jgi:hypothetical protein
MEMPDGLKQILDAYNPERMLLDRLCSEVAAKAVMEDRLIRKEAQIAEGNRETSLLKRQLAEAQGVNGSSSLAREHALARARAAEASKDALLTSIGALLAASREYLQHVSNFSRSQLGARKQLEHKLAAAIDTSAAVFAEHEVPF